MASFSAGSPRLDDTDVVVAPLATTDELRRHALRVPAVEWLSERPRSRYRIRASITVAFGVAWMLFSIIVAQPWWNDLRETLGALAGTLIIFGIAWLPGYLYAQLFASVLLDERPVLPELDVHPPVTVVIAVFNEQDALAPTVEHLLASTYSGDMSIIIADDGSEDETLARAAELARRYDNVTALAIPHGGKHSALNAALLHVRTPLVLTVDADTLVEPDALRRIVARLVGTAGCFAVAGSLLVSNDDDTLIARMQGWEYRLSIAAIKRQQAMFGATLVAQGAFSVYATREVLSIGGWPDAIGEDILVTWALIEAGGQVEFEPTAFARTEAPTTTRALYRQRRRWARGMIEGLRTSGGTMTRSRRLVAHNVMINYLLPLIDVAYLFVFIPGLVAAVFFDNNVIVGPMTIAVLPMALALFWAMGRAGRRARREAGVVLNRQWSGFVAYMTFYRTLIAAASIAGYALEFRGRDRDW